MKLSLLSLLVVTISVSASAQNTLLFEDFNAGLPAGWGVFNEDGLTPDASVSYINDAWVISEDTDSTGMMDSCLISTSYYDPAGQSDDWLVLPAVTLGNGGNYLYWDAKSEDPAFPDSYEIWINTTGGNVSDFTDTAYVKIDNENPLWQSRLVKLDSFANQTVYIAFRNVSDDQFILFLDNIHITELDPLSVNQLVTETYVVYPNPAVNFIQLADTPEGSSYLITDMAGKLLDNGILHDRIDVSGLSTGTYLLGIKSPGKPLSFSKFVKR